MKAILLMCAMMLAAVFANPNLRKESVMLIRGDADLMATLIDQKFDVRGTYGEYVFVFTTNFRALTLAAKHADAVNIQVSHSSQMIVVEGDSTTESWELMLNEIDAQADTLTILFQSKNLVFLTFNTNKRTPYYFDFSTSIPLPRDAEFITLPSRPLVPVKMSEDHPALRPVTYKTSVAELVAAINEDDIRDFAVYLSGEGGGSDFTTRHSYSDDGVRAGEWAMGVFKSYGFNASQDVFPGQYCPNIVAEMRGTRTPNQYVIIGAHLDCRNANLGDSNGRAPGANDDGSGSAAVLQVAKAIFDTGASFASTLQLHLYCGEEQGLVGSRALARDYSNSDLNILGMFQADMIGYQAYAQPQCAFVNRYTNLALTNYAKDIAATYVPEITRVDTTACCSDHQSFYELGYPSVGLVEGGGYSIDPFYHHIGDTVNRNGYSLNQMRSITRILAASAADLAGIQ